MIYDELKTVPLTIIELILREYIDSKKYGFFQRQYSIRLHWFTDKHRMIEIEPVTETSFTLWFDNGIGYALDEVMFIYHSNVILESYTLPYWVYSHVHKLINKTSMDYHFGHGIADTNLYNIPTTNLHVILDLKNENCSITLIDPHYQYQRARESEDFCLYFNQEIQFYALDRRQKYVPSPEATDPRSPGKVLVRMEYCHKGTNPEGGGILLDDASDESALRAESIRRSPGQRKRPNRLHHGVFRRAVPSYETPSNPKFPYEERTLI